jgi:hypothetical protein
LTKEEPELKKKRERGRHKHKVKERRLWQKKLLKKPMSKGWMI